MEKNKVTIKKIKYKNIFNIYLSLNKKKNLKINNKSLFFKILNSFFFLNCFNILTERKKFFFPKYLKNEKRKNCCFSFFKIKKINCIFKKNNSFFNFLFKYAINFSNKTQNLNKQNINIIFLILIFCLSNFKIEKIKMQVYENSIKIKTRSEIKNKTSKFLY